MHSHAMRVSASRCEPVFAACRIRRCMSWCAAGTVLSMLLTPALLAAADEAVKIDKTDLFVAGEEGYQLYRIPGIVVTRRGTILAYCEARKSDRGDWGPIDVLLRRSTDGGNTWQPRQKIVHIEGDLPINPVAAAQQLDKPGDNTVNNPVAIVDHKTGAVHFLYCLEYMRCFYMRSDDDGATWTEPVEITKTFEEFRSEYQWKVIATGPGHGIQLTRGTHAGRLVVPVWLSLGTGGHAHRPSVTATIYSDDRGKTWRRGAIAVPDTPDFIFPNETVVVQLADGRVMLNSRSESKRHRRLVTVSTNGAGDWSEPRFDEALLEPICMAGIVRVRYPTEMQPGVIAFSNPHNLARRNGDEAPGRSRDRRNVSVKLSFDEGKTWPVNRTLEEGFSGYSDVAALENGTILCFYERGSTDGDSNYRTGRLTVARFDEQWVKDSQASPEHSAGTPHPDLALEPAYVINSPWRQHIPPTKRQGVPGIERTSQGRLWAVYGRDVESPRNYQVLTKSDNDGRSWSDVKLMILPRQHVRAMSAAIWIDSQGRMWVFWGQSFGQQDGRYGIWAIVTEEPDAETPRWSQPRRLGDGIMLNKPTVLSNGDWLLTSSVWKADNSIRVYASSDQGRTFQLRGTAHIPDPEIRGPDEPMIVERNDGSLWMMVRVRGLGETISRDGGKTWTPVARISLPHPTSRFFLRRLNSGALLLVKHGPLDERTGREQLTAYVSDDDGRTWQGGLRIDEREKVTYPDGVQAPDGTIYIIYDYNRTPEGAVLMAAFHEEDVRAGMPVSDHVRLRVEIDKLLTNGEK